MQAFQPILHTTIREPQFQDGKLIPGEVSSRIIDAMQLGEVVRIRTDAAKTVFCDWNAKAYSVGAIDLLEYINALNALLPANQRIGLTESVEEEMPECDAMGMTGGIFEPEMP